MIKLPPDITFVIQIVAFVIFWQLMRVVLFRPAQRALEARAECTTGARARADELRLEAGALAGEIEATLGAARAEGMRQADQIRRRAEAEEQAVVERYRSEVASLLEREGAVTAAQVEVARAPLQAEAERLTAGVVAKVLGRNA